MSTDTTSHKVTTHFHGDRFHPACSCGFEGEPARWADVAAATANAHLIEVGAPGVVLPPVENRRAYNARRYGVGRRAS